MRDANPSRIFKLNLIERCSLYLWAYTAVCWKWWRLNKGTLAMIKPILTAAALCFAAATAASALPVSQTTSLRPLNFSDLIQVGQKNKNKNQNQNHDNHNHDNHNHNHGYHHGGRYYGHRYYARPYNWQALGCVVVGPVWYCP